jgi:hypothetical protein
MIQWSPYELLGPGGSVTNGDEVPSEVAREVDPVTSQSGYGPGEYRNLTINRISSQCSFCELWLNAAIVGLIVSVASRLLGRCHPSNSRVCGLERHGSLNRSLVHGRTRVAGTVRTGKAARRTATTPDEHWRCDLESALETASVVDVIRAVTEDDLRSLIPLRPCVSVDTREGRDGAG